MLKITYTKESTNKLVKEVLQKARVSFVVFLHGQLGVGKTYFAAQLLKQLGVKESVTSPTFSIVNEYESTDLKIFHYDLYRIEDAAELPFIGIEEHAEEGMLIIEWPEIARKFGIEPDMEIFLNYTEDENTRKAKIIVYNE